VSPSPAGLDVLPAKPSKVSAAAAKVNHQGFDLVIADNTIHEEDVFAALDSSSSSSSSSSNSALGPAGRQQQQQQQQQATCTLRFLLAEAAIPSCPVLSDAAQSLLGRCQAALPRTDVTDSCTALKLCRHVRDCTCCMCTPRLFVMDPVSRLFFCILAVNVECARSCGSANWWQLLMLLCCRQVLHVLLRQALDSTCKVMQHGRCPCTPPSPHYAPCPQPTGHLYSCNLQQTMCACKLVTCPIVLAVAQFTYMCARRVVLCTCMHKALCWQPMPLRTPECTSLYVWMLQLPPAAPPRRCPSRHC